MTTINIPAYEQRWLKPLLPSLEELKDYIINVLLYCTGSIFVSICVLWTFGGPYSGFTMPGGFVAECKFSQISKILHFDLPSDHIDFDFDVAEPSSAVNSNDGSNHFWYDDPVSLVSLDGLGFLSW